jgi:hypothetical protein
MSEALVINPEPFDEYIRRTGMTGDELEEMMFFAAAIRPWYDDRLLPLWHGWNNQVEAALSPLATIISVREDEGKTPPIDRLITAKSIIAHEAGYTIKPEVMGLEMREDVAKKIAVYEHQNSLGHSRGVTEIKWGIEATKRASKNPRLGYIIGNRINAVAVRAVDTHGIRRDYDEFEEATIRIKAEGIVLRRDRSSWTQFAKDDEAFLRKEYGQELKLTDAHFHDDQGRSAWLAKLEENYQRLRQKIATQNGLTDLILRTWERVHEAQNGPWPVQSKKPDSSTPGLWVPWEVAQTLYEGSRLRERWDDASGERQSELLSWMDAARHPYQRVAVARQVGKALLAA